MAWPKKSRLRVCDICGSEFSPLDWANHKYAHLSEEEKAELRRQLQEEAKRNPKPGRPESEVFKGFSEEDEERERRWRWRTNNL